MSAARSGGGPGSRLHVLAHPYARKAILFWTLMGALLLAFCGVSVLTLADLRQDAWNQATSASRNLVSVLSQQVERDVETYDTALRRIATRLQTSGFAGLDAATQHSVLFEDGFVDPALAALLVLDGEGAIVWDRDSQPPRRGAHGTERYFAVHRDDAAAGLFVSAPLQPPSGGGDRVVALSRRLSDEAGRFSGVVVGMVRLRHFTRILDADARASGDVVNLLTAEGVVLARTPPIETAIGQDLSTTPAVRHFLESRQGTFAAVSPLDGVRRIYSFRHLDGAPLILSLALAEDDIYAVWNRRATAIGLMLALLSGLALALAILIRREFGRRLRTERTLRRSEEQYRLLADHSTDIIIRLDAQFIRRYVSPASRTVLGFEPSELMGQRSRTIIHPDDWSEVERIAQNARVSAGGTQAVYRIRRRDGGHIWVEGRYSYVPGDGGFIVVLRDIDRRRAVEAQLAAANAELLALANTDPLTGLANRRRFDDALAAAGGAAGTGALSILMMDIDHFKRFNDRYGHPAGDGCLRAVAGAIKGAVEGIDALPARLGGEEIAVLLREARADEALALAERIRDAVEALAIAHEGNGANGGVVTISIGCATRGTDAPAESNLMEEADALLYEAKRTGRNRVVSILTLAAEGQAAPCGADEATRLEAVERFRALQASERGEDLSAVAGRVAKLLDMPIGFVSVHGADKVDLVGRHNIAAESADKETAFCRHAVIGTEPVVVPDLAADPRFSANPLVNCAGGIRFYAGAPLIDPRSGVAIGAVSVCDTRPRERFTPQQRNILATFAQMVMYELA